MKDPATHGLDYVLTKDDIVELLQPHKEELRARPLYITIDKVRRRG